jgi:hypothetical protein
MKTVISYVSGTAGDFVVNCCNSVWTNAIRDNGLTVASASMKSIEYNIGNQEWLEKINAIPYQHVGSHLIERLLQLPVIPMWVVVPELTHYLVWARRDCLTRKVLLGKHGDIFEKIKSLVLQGRGIQAAEFYLQWITNYNWTLMQMRLVQTANKIDVTGLLSSDGIDNLIDQLEILKPVATQCRKYHRAWLSQQPDSSESATLHVLSEKLSELVTVSASI